MALPLDIQTHRWALGRRQVGTRSLTPGELARLEAELRLARRDAWWPLVAVGAGIVLGVAALWIFRDTVGPGNALAVVLMMVWVFAAQVGLAAAILRCRDKLRIARLVAGEIQAGLVDVFEAVEAPDGAPPDRELAAPVALSVSSDRVIEGPFALRGKRARVSDVADGTHGAYRVPSVARVEGASVEQRRLSESEREELRRTIVRARRVDRRVLWPVAVFTLGLFWIRPTGTGPGAFADVLVLSFGAVIAGLAVFRWVREFRTSMLLEKDLDTGIVLWISPIDGSGPAVEVLPLSRVIWWGGHAPAGWRSMGDKRTRG